MNAKRMLILGMVVILLLGMLACKGGGGTPTPDTSAQETYGAEQFEQWKQANETPEP